MMISTRGRYALRVLVDLARSPEGEYVPMKVIAARQGISLKYLEQILPVLTRNGMIEGMHGKGGGYRLTKAPSEYRVGDVLRLTEGSLAPVACLADDAAPCERADSCSTIALWTGLEKVINEYLDGAKLSDLI